MPRPRRSRGSWRFLHAFWAVRQRLDAEVQAPLVRETGLDLRHLVLLEYVAMIELAPSEIAASLRLPAHVVRAASANSSVGT